jgi:two-component system sensor histidine kinase TctE
LQIALTVEGGQAVLTIADHGAGIAAADAERVRALRARRRRASGGAGLGLAIVKRVVDSHGGRIDLSNRPQGGLVATIRLPRSSHDPPVRHGRCPAAGPAGAGRAG